MAEEQVILSWDAHEIAAQQVKFLKDEDEEFKGKEEDEIYGAVQEDSIFWEIEWQDLTEQLTELMKECNPDDLKWIATVSGFGWRNQTGYREPFDATDGASLLRAILLDTDNTFWIYNHEHNGRKGFKINNCHHDSPVRGKEWYYIVPVTEEEADELFKRN